MTVTHGLRSTYTNGCRCKACTSANTEYQHQVGARRRARQEAGDPAVPHGTVGGYNNWGCRCEACSAAHSEKMARGRARRMAATRDQVPHGTVSGYNSWGCRCHYCSVAAAYDRRQRRRSESV